MDSKQLIIRSRERGRLFTLALTLWTHFSSALFALFPDMKLRHFLAPIYYPVRGLWDALLSGVESLPVLMLPPVLLPLIGYLLLRRGLSAGRWLIRVPMVLLLVLDGILLLYHVLSGRGALLMEEHGSFLLLLAAAVLFPALLLYALYLWNPSAEELRADPGQRADAQASVSSADKTAARNGTADGKHAAFRCQVLLIYLLATGLPALLFPDVNLFYALCPTGPLLRFLPVSGFFSPLLGRVLAILLTLLPVLGWVLLRKGQSLGAVVIRVCCVVVTLLMLFLLLLSLHSSIGFDDGFSIPLLFLPLYFGFPILLFSQLNCFYPWK